MSTFTHAERRSLAAPIASSLVRSRRLPAPEALGLIALAAVLNLWALDRNGWANDYYAAAVRSMTSSWHNFFFGSFDASGIMTVDKPPLALWVQALSARIFGFHSLSLLVPQALMGVASVALVYDLTRRLFGRPAGFVAGLVLALTPITVAISRHNNPDALLVLCCVGAVWALVRALQDGRTRWLVLSGLLVGLGFEAKMGVALMVVPGVAVAWLGFAPAGRMRAFRQLLAGGATMAVAGLAWPVAVALTPAADRPWISGTSDNSIWSLILGYNGFGRLDGQSGGPGGTGGPGGGGPFGGSAGPLRLLNQALGGQGGWVLGTALVSLVAIAFVTRLRRRDARSAWLFAVGGSFAISAVAFSFAKGIFHPYYVALLAPFTAALVGAGFGLVLKGEPGMRVFGPLAVITGAMTELAVLGSNPGQLTWLRPVLVVIAAGAAVLVVGFGSGSGAARWRSGAVATALAILMLAPASWAVQTLGHATSSTFPSGGPASASAMGGGPGGMGGRFGGPPSGTMQAPAGPPQAPAGGMSGGNSTALSVSIAYAEAHGGGAVAGSSQQGASGSIIGSGSNVVAIGGFSGRESQVSISWFAQQVAAGKIRWVVADSGGGIPSDGRTGAKGVMAVVASICKAVKTSGGTLYDCQGYASALAKLAS